VIPEFEPTVALAELVRHRVDFVCIGGVAAILNGSNQITFDLDVCPDPRRPNLDRLSDALRSLEARVRVEGVDGGFEFTLSGESLGRARIWNLVTRAGDLDLCFLPAGTDGYDDLVRNAHEVDGGDGHMVLVASLADIVRSKRAADRPKDHVTLPILEELLRYQEQPDE